MLKLTINAFVLFLLLVGISCTTELKHFDEQILEEIPESIQYSTDYDGHLQGFATDYKKYIYWSHTRQLVKTDLKGSVLKEIDVQNHHGDLEFCKGKIYVAVNFGKFNEEPGLADSWIYVYNAKDLSFIEKHPVPEVVHGAGGIAIHHNRIMVVGGLPEKGNYELNYVYEYDMNLNFIKRHDLRSGYTYKGIQTACYYHNHWYFACYGSTRVGVVPKVLKVQENSNGDLEFVKSYDVNMSYGMIGLQGEEFLYSSGVLDKKAQKGVLK